MDRSKNGDFMIMSVAELAYLSYCFMDLVDAEVNKRTAVSFLLLLHVALCNRIGNQTALKDLEAKLLSCYTIHVRIFANVPIQPQTRSHNLRSYCGP